MEDSEELTTLHVRRATDGDPASIAWIIDRFTPALLTQAQFRLDRHLRGLYDPEDLLQDVWAVMLPRLGDLTPRDGRLTPVLLRFLSTALLNRYGTLIQKHIAGKPLRAHDVAVPGSAPRGDPCEQLPAEQTTVVTKAVRHEATTRLLAALTELSESDREIIVLRGLEQTSIRTVAQLLRITENAASVRYHRALHRLRERLPDSVFAELAAV
jgi:RNA polymerase sigma-70 factor (ECF subfamily)